MRILTFSLFFLSSICAFAQTDEAAVKAKEILQKVSVQTKSYQSIQADFSFTMENLQEKINETHHGSILLKGNQYKISLMGVENLFDGKTLYTWMKEAGEVNLSEPDLADESTLNPATIFTIYEKGYKLKYVGEKTVNGKTMQEIDLYPENRDKPYSRVKLMVNKETAQIHSFMQQGKDGNNYTIVVTKMNTNVPANASDFVFNKAQNPKVQVIDLR